VEAIGQTRFNAESAEHGAKVAEINTRHFVATFRLRFRRASACPEFADGGQRHESVVSQLKFAQIDLTGI
jgi:hypothetical protein